jgi:hypothetical protein
MPYTGIPVYVYQYYIYIIRLNILIIFKTDQEIIEISPTIVGLAMTSSMEWSKFSAMLSSETTQELEGEKFKHFIVYRKVFFFKSQKSSINT